MATLKSNLHIPVEVLSLVLTYIDDVSDLSKVSLASRAWYQLVFPELHLAMLLGKDSHFEMLTARLESESTEDSMRIGYCLRSLLIELPYSFLDSDQGRPLVLRFQQVLPKLGRLQHLGWTCINLPRSLNIFESFRDSCPQLRRLSLTRWETSRERGAFHLFFQSSLLFTPNFELVQINMAKR
jgi:hypothetical protein